MIIQIPFSGFYESIHDGAINDAIDYAFVDYETGWNNNDKLSQRLYDAINWRDLFTDYAKAYAENFAHIFKIKMTFESLSSPREYNFTTDRIFCKISQAEVKRLYSEVDKFILDETCAAMFTSRDGFTSFYDPDFLNWPAITKWDHNQLNALLTAWLETIQAGDYEAAIYETLCCNGLISELLYKHCTDKRIFKVHDYLQNRKAA